VLAQRIAAGAFVAGPAPSTVAMAGRRAMAPMSPGTDYMPVSRLDGIPIGAQRTAASAWSRVLRPSLTRGRSGRGDGDERFRCRPTVRRRRVSPSAPVPLQTFGPAAVPQLRVRRRPFSMRRAILLRQLVRHAIASGLTRAATDASPLRSRAIAFFFCGFGARGNVVRASVARAGPRMPSMTVDAD